MLLQTMGTTMLVRCRRTVLAISTLTLVVMSSHGAAAAPPPVFPGVPAPRETGVIVKVHPGFLPQSTGLRTSAADPAAEVLQWTAGAGVAEAHILWNGPPIASRAAAAIDHPGQRTFVLTPDSGLAPGVVVSQLEQLPWVEYAEVDRLVSLHDTPNDPYYPRQWHLENAGQPYWSVVRADGPDNDTLAELNGVSGADVRFLTAYNHAGEKTSIRVCIIDTGLDTDHEDLTDRLLLTPGEIPGNGIDDDHNGYIDDVYGWDFSGDTQGTPSDVSPDNDVSDPIGHGTHVGGTVAATVNNGLGIAGVADSARVFSAKIFPNSFFSVGAEAIYYAVVRGARVINMSWGGAYPSNALRDAVQYAHARGCVLVASTGNSGREEIFYPSGYPETIAIGATNASDYLASFSTYGGQVDVVAPGEDILSLRGFGTDMYADGGEPNIHIIDETYYIASGTSMSAPHATGVVAALLSISPGLSNERIREILSTTSDDIPDPYGDGANLPGYDKFTGWGRVNLTNAIAALPGVFSVIDSPSPGEWTGGLVAIEGYATGEAFAGYEILIAPGHQPQEGDWTTIESSGTRVSNGVLGQWNTDGLGGPYTIRLDAGTDAVVDIPVNIVQEPNATITSPSAGETIKLTTTVMGTAAAPDFTEYRLDAVGPLPATTVRPIFASTRPVWADTLALWGLDQLTPGSYWLRLTLEAPGGIWYDSVQVGVENVFHAGWPYALPANSHFAVTAIDLDRDHVKEIVCPTNKGLWVLAGDSSSYQPWDGTSTWPLYPGWPRDTLVSYRTAPAFADLDRDGKYEIIIPTTTSMNVFTWIGESYFQWPRPFNGASNFYGVSLPSVGDVDSDGNLEIAAIERTGNIKVWRESGSPYVPSDMSFGSVPVTHSLVNSLPHVTICDLNRDNQSEVIAIGDEIHIFDGRTGKPYRNMPSSRIASHYSIHGAAIGDFDNDARRDIAYVAVDGATDNYFVTVTAIRQFWDEYDLPYDSAITLPGWPRFLSAPQDQYLLYAMTAGDIDGDRRPEIFVAPYSLSEGLLYAFRSDGSPVLSESPDGLFARQLGSISSVAIIDIDHDGEPEVVFRVEGFLSGPDQVFAYEADGNLVTGYPITFGTGSSRIPATPIIGDINNDGWADMVTVHATGSSVAVWDLANPASSVPQTWPRFQADIWNTGVVNAPLYDVLYMGRLIDYLFLGAAPFPIYESADLNCDGEPNALDLNVLIDYLFAGGQPPCGP
jgi:hypothetical protein